MLHQRLDILNGVIARSIQLEDIIATSFVKSVTTFAFVARLSLCSWVLAVNSFGENAGTSSLSYAPRTTEKISMSKLPALHSVLQRSRQRLLSNDRIKGHRAVLTCRNDIFTHNLTF